MKGKTGQPLLELDRADAILSSVLAREPDSPLAHAVRGELSMLRWDWQAADRLTTRGKELAPTHQRALFHRGYFLQLTGRFDEQLARKRFQVDMNPKNQFAVANLAMLLVGARRFQEALDYAHSVEHRITKPNDKLLLWIALARAHAELTHYTEALEVADRVMAMPEREGNDFLAMLAPVYVMSGRREGALAVKAVIYDNPDVELINKAVIDDALGDIDTALGKLETLVAAHHIGACYLKTIRLSPQLRSHPRFQALLRRVGFP